MTNAQMTDGEKARNRSEKLDAYQRAVDDCRNYCTVLNEIIETLETVTRLYRESDLHVTGPENRPVFGSGIVLPSHADLVAAVNSCERSKQATKECRSAAVRAGVDLTELEKIDSSGPRIR